MQVQEIKPYSQQGSKKVQIEEMFNDISGRYDFLNHFLSLGIDRSWRRALIRAVMRAPHDRWLDVATGTADVAIAAARAGAGSVTGVDISENMLEVGREKIKRLSLQQVELRKGDSENLEFPDQSFDVVTVAFGVRNFEDLEKGLREMLRVLRPGGQLAVLEFSYPKRFPVRQLYRFYNATLLPFFGKLWSGSSTAYRYLPASVAAFPEGSDFLQLLDRCGFTGQSQKMMTFGICSLYTAFKQKKD